MTYMCRRTASANERNVRGCGLVSGARGRGERRDEEGVRRERVKRQSMWGHHRREARGGGADEFSPVDEHLLIRQEGGHGANVGDP